MKKVLIQSSALVLLASAVLAFGGPVPKKAESGGSRGLQAALGAGSFLIDDLESGSIQSPRQWWTFDLQKVGAELNDSLTAGDPAVVIKKGRYSLELKGVCKNWYAGGTGVYFAKERQDLSQNNFLQLDVYGQGAGSGTIKIELLDDDNNNWQIEQDPAKNYAPTVDDKFVYSLVVDWPGWRHVSVPLNDFVDDNPHVGDDVWNPQQTGGSGGLLQMQLICLGSKDDSKIDLFIDNIELTENER